MLAREAITGLVLCGGRGSRMGGLDKGLQPFRGQPLVRHAIERLAPQVGSIMISANRNLDAYAAYGVPVRTDTLPDHPGPLAGVLAGLTHCQTEWLACVPCDSPWFPEDLVQRLALTAVQAGALAAVAVNADDGRMQPVFGLLHRSQRASLQAALEAGRLKAEDWWRSVRAASAAFTARPAAAGPNGQPTPQPFDNLNTLSELRGASRRS